MNIQKVKQGAKITLGNGIYMVILGLFLIFFRRINMKENFVVIDKLWGFFLRYNPEISHLFYLFNILLGIFMLSIGIFIIYLSDFIIKRKEKTSWVVLFLSGIVAWAGFLTISILFKNWLLIALSSAGWVSFVVGMVWPIRYYLEKTYREY